MSLYRTYRPKSFNELVGQETVVRTLTSAIEAGKIAHAYLFSGPRGSGKTSAAKIMARCIDCIHGPTATPDNTCDNCIAMLEGTALDVLEIDAASNRGIDEIRALRDAVKFAPSVMRMKVYIIDEAHMLTKEGANAFLKTLEEPPAHAVFILATTEPEKLPVTILSRCQRYAFRRITIPIMIERMREIAAAENIAIDEHALAAIAYRADGGLRDALTMLEQAAAFAEGTITTQTIDIAFGATGRNYAHPIVDAMLVKDPVTALRTIEEASDSGADMQVLLRSLVAEFRNLMIAKVDPELLQRDLAPEDAKSAATRAESTTTPVLLQALRLLADAASLSRTSNNPRLELESALLRFTLSDASREAVPAQPPVRNVGPAAGAMDGGKRPAAERDSDQDGSMPPRPGRALSAARSPEGEASSGSGKEVEPAQLPGPSHPTQPNSTMPQEPPTVNKLRAAWKNIRSKVESQRPPLAVPLSRALVESIDGNAVTLKLPDAMSVDILREHTKLIEEAIHDILGTALKVLPKADSSNATKSAGPSTGKSAGPTPAAAKPRANASAPIPPAEDADALFQYANERIRER